MIWGLGIEIAKFVLIVGGALFVSGIPLAAWIWFRILRDERKAKRDQIIVRRLHQGHGRSFP